MQQYRFEMWQEDNWVTQFVVDFLNYDVNNNILETMFSECFTGECEESSRIFAEYDEQNNRTQLLYQDKLSDGWINSTQYLYGYDIESNLVFDILQRWNSGQLLWDNATNIKYSYDINRNLISTLVSGWGSSDWTKSQRYSYKYQDEYKIEELYEAYDNEWKNQIKTIFHYKGITDITIAKDVIKEFSLSQNYPNPFNPSTKIKYTIPVVNAYYESTTLVQLKVYNILGKEVATLVNKEQPSGSYEVEFNPSTKKSSGVYFYTLRTGSFVETKKMLLLR